jgi:hypothetical protein
MDNKSRESEKQVEELSEQVTKLRRAVSGGLVFLVVFAFVVAPAAAGVATGTVVLCWALAPLWRRLI